MLSVCNMYLNHSAGFKVILFSDKEEVILRGLGFIIVVQELSHLSAILVKKRKQIATLGNKLYHVCPSQYCSVSFNVFVLFE